MAKNINNSDLALKIGEVRGRLEGLENRIAAIHNDIAELRAEMGPVREAVASAKGGWKMLITVGVIAGSLGAFAGKLLSFLPKGLT